MANVTLAAWHKRKAIPEIEPLYIGFASAGAALEHRAQKGGWLFVSDASAGAVWFDPQFTPSAIFRHPAAKGSGRLI